MVFDKSKPVVNSSNILKLEYATPNKVLQITFHTGAVYQYAGVPQHIYDGLCTAPSVGSYFQSMVKNVYTTTKVK